MYYVTLQRTTFTGCDQVLKAISRQLSNTPQPAAAEAVQRPRTHTTHAVFLHSSQWTARPKATFCIELSELY